MPPSAAITLRCPICTGEDATQDPDFGEGLLRCPACRFMFLPGAVDSAELYADDYFEGYDGGDYLAMERDRRRESRVRLDLLATVAPAPARLVEIGAAAGFFLAEAGARGYTGVGVEPNEAMATYARDALGLDVRTGLIEEARLPAASFDAACAFHVVEHVPDPVAVLTAVGGLLRPGGHLLIEVPNVESATARRQGTSWPALDLPYHVGHHGPPSLGRLLERAGLETVLVDTVPFLHYGEPRGPAALWRLAAAGRESLRARRPLGPGPHPADHQLLRGVARRSER